MAKFLCICIGLTKFKENPEGSSIFCVDLTWNDPSAPTYIARGKRLGDKALCSDDLACKELKNSCYNSGGIETVPSYQ